MDDVFVHTRIPLHLVQRTGTRLNQLVSPFWSDRPRWHRAVTVGLGAVDVAIAARLKKDPRLQLAWRLPLDAAELALACAMAIRDDYEEASVPAIPGCPLAVEAGGRLGWRGLIVPAANLVVGRGVRTARGHQPRTGTMAWQVAAAVGGMGLAAYGRRRRKAALESHHREFSALLAQAELAGHNDIAMSDESLLDEVQRATLLIDLGAREAVSANVAGAWKAELAARSRTEFVYLGDELRRWQAKSNAARPDLARVVRLVPSVEAATVLLSGAQASALHDGLDALGLSGQVQVTAEDRRGDVRLTIGDHELRLIADRPSPKTSFDPVPGAFCWSALWLYVAGARSREHVPKWAAVGPAVASLTAAFGAHRLGKRNEGRAPRATVVGWSAGITLGAVVVQTKSMRNTHGHGQISRYPFSLSLRGFMLIALLAWRELSTVGKSAAAATTAGTIGLGWMLSPEPRSARELVAELVWPLQSVTLGGSLVEAIDRDAGRLGDEIRMDDERRLVEAREAGRARALEFVAACLADAERSLTTARDELPEDLADEVQRRVRRCRHRLDHALTGVGATQLGTGKA